MSELEELKKKMEDACDAASGVDCGVAIYAYLEAKKEHEKEKAKK